LRLLDRCVELKPRHLFLVGDIFDLWISDRRYFVNRYGEAVKRLLRLKDLGTQIHYFEGNHDLDLKLYWQHHLGFDVQEEAAYFDLDGQLFRVEHGDQMDQEDQGYLFLRWLLRTPLLRFLCRNLPDRVVEWIGRLASSASRNYTSHVKTTTEARTRAIIHAHACAAHRRRPFDVLVAGHVHMTEDREVFEGDRRFRCINLGSWFEAPQVLVVGRRREDLEFRALDDL
jgi:UDP-2,3-diacylglucosamine hydrolase